VNFLLFMKCIEWGSFAGVRNPMLPKVCRPSWTGVLVLAILLFFSNASDLAADQQGPASVGTAFAVSGKGHLLTAYHVIREKTQIFVGPLPNGQWTLATVDRVDLRHDLALLQISIDTDPWCWPR